MAPDSAPHPDSPPSHPFLVIIGGHSRSVGKTSLVAGLIAAMPECGWTAIKITQYGHGVCSAHGEPCDCAPSALDHEWVITEERDPSGGSDTSRFLASGARRALWVRTRQGMLAEAIPALRERLGGSSNVIMESNSALQFFRPDVYLTVLDPSIPDFKESAKRFLDRADALVLHSRKGQPRWQGISLRPAAHSEVFHIQAPGYCTAEIVQFVKNRMGRLRDCGIGELPN
ncbi:MAG: hypothetical protein JO041_02970 [Acidobacteria bacterium]|nr:hypothetical protein [Acidobacteriota bacterium]